MDQQILDYINRARVSGLSDESIRQQLLSQGLTDGEIAGIMGISAHGHIPVARKVNIKKMISKGFLGALAGLVVGAMLAGTLGDTFKLAEPVVWVSFFAVLILMIFLFGLWGAKSMTKEELQNAIVSLDSLSRKEEVIAWVFNVINPVIAGAVMYYIWHPGYPAKAKKANQISIIVFFAEVALGILFVALYPR